MRWYAPPGRVRARQIRADVATLAWIVLWVLAAVGVRALSVSIAEPLDQTRQVAERMAGSAAAAAQGVAGLPLFGQTLSTTFSTLVTNLHALATMAGDQSEATLRVGVVVALATGIIPVAIRLTSWGAARLSYAREAAIAARLPDSPQTRDLFALRALAGAPLADLVGLGPDLVARWRAGDPAVIAGLAALELADRGLTLAPDPGVRAGAAPGVPRA